MGKILRSRAPLPVVFLFVATICISLLIISYGSRQKSQAAFATCYWVGDTSPANWNDATHWSSLAGGAGSTCDGGVVPGSDDSVIFTSDVTNSATFDNTSTILNLTINAGYTGTITQSATRVLTVSTAFTQHDGTFTTGDQNINIGSYTLDGGTFNAGAGTVTLTGNFTHTAATGTFNEDTGTLKLTSLDTTYDFNSSETFNNVEVAKGAGNLATVNTGDTMVIAGTFTLTTGILRTGTFDARGNINQGASFNGSAGTAVLDFGDNAVAQDYTTAGGTGPNIRFDHASDANDEVIFSTTDATFTGISTTVNFVDGNTVPFTYNAHNLTVGAAGFTLITGTFNAPTTITFSACSFTHNVATGTYVEGTNTIFSGGSSTADFNSSETFNAVQINSTGNVTITAGDTMVVAGVLTLTNGQINTGIIDTRGDTNQASTFDWGTATLDFGDNGVNQVYTTAGGVGPIIRFNNASDANDSVVLSTADAGLVGISMTVGFGDANTANFNYNGHNLTLYDGGLNLVSGIFNAPTTLTFSAPNFGASPFTHTAATGVFNEGTNTVFSGYGITVDFNGSETFNNVTVDMFLTIDRLLVITAGDTMVVTGTLTLTRGSVTTGIIDAKGGVTAGASFAGGNSPLTLSGTGDQAYSIAGVPLSGVLKLNKDTGLTTLSNSSTTARTLTLSSAAQKSGGLAVNTSGTGGLTLAGATNNPNVTLTGGLSFGKTSTGVPALTMGTATAWSATGDVNFTNAALTQGTSTLTLNGSAAQAFTAGGTGAGHTPYKITVTNSSGPSTGVTFADSLTLAAGGTFTDTTGDSKLTFADGATFTFPIIAINGAVGQTINMTKGAGANGHWFFNVAAANPTVTYVAVDHSDATGSSSSIDDTVGGVNNLNNINWDFPLAAPDAPTIGTATAGAGVGQATITFTPGSDGGSPITGYTVTSTPSSITGTGASSPITVSGLANGTAYTFTVHATNAIGDSVESAVSNSITTFAVPDAPTIGVATPGNAQASVAFTPGSDGGTPITGYTVISTPGSFTGTGAGSPITVNGLTNGTAYTFTVHATNIVGNSAESANSAPVTPSTIPSAPTIGTATAGAGVGQATVTFTPGSDGGSVITGYTVTSTPSSITGTGASSPITVSGLANGTAYTFTVHATNANGNSSESAASNSITTFAVPDAPTGGVTAVKGNAKATVYFSVPGSDGGTPITGYTVTSTPGSFTGTGAGSPIDVNGLTNGTSYTFTVHATNIVGDGPESSVSNAVIPSTIPGAPTIGTATAGSGAGQATVTFTPPGSDGSSAITGYTVTSTPDSITGTGAGSPITVSGLANNTAYTFTVHATNANGNSVESAASNSITTFTVPDAPTIGTATGGNAQASVTFTPPGSDGGSAITGYTVTSTPGNFTGTGAGSPITVNGLTNGTLYTFTVHATNIVGDSAESGNSNAVTPSTIPNAPTGILAAAGNAQAQVAFTAPADGGSPITSYTVTSTPDNITGTGVGSPITVSGLANGTAYTFTVHAANVNGDGPESAPSNAVTPFGLTPTCTDGIQNGDETGIDTGGSCPVPICAGCLPICTFVDHITITPTPNVISTNLGVTFTASAYDASDNLLPGADFSWQKSAGTLNAFGTHNQTASYITQADPGAAWVKAISCEKSKTANFLVVSSAPTLIQLAASPHDQVIAPGAKIQYSAVVRDQAGADITSVCPVTWSMRIPTAGSINSNGLMASTSRLGTWRDAVKAETSCFGLTDFDLLTFVTTNEVRRLEYVSFDPRYATAKKAVDQSIPYQLRPYDQFGLLFRNGPSYSFNLLDQRIGTISNNRYNLTVEASDNYGCYPNKIEGRASYNGVEKAAYASIAIYPADYNLASAGSSCSDDLSTRILLALTGADKAKADGQVLTTVKYSIAKYYLPGQSFSINTTPRDQINNPIESGITTQFILMDPAAGQLSSDGRFIASTLPGSYPNAIEIRTSDGQQTITKTFDITVQAEKRRAVKIKVLGTIGATKLTTSKILEMWPGSYYTFVADLIDQFGESIASTMYFNLEDVSGQNLTQVLGPTSLKAGNQEGNWTGAMKLTFDLERFNATRADDAEKIDGPAPELYLNLDINQKNDNPTACLSTKYCDPEDESCLCPNGNCGADGGGGGGIIGTIKDIIDGIIAGIRDNLLTSIAAIAALLLALLALLFSASTNLLTYIRPDEFWAWLVKGGERKNAKGLVYDAQTGFPIPLAQIRLFRVRDNKLLTVATTNKKGRFALETPAGEEYFLEVMKFGFLMLKNTDLTSKLSLAYEHNYFGQSFRPTESNTFFSGAIPMKYGIESKELIKNARASERFAKVLRLLNIPILLFGFTMSIISLRQTYSWFNWIIFAFYIAIFIFYLMRYLLHGRTFGFVYANAKNLPVDLAVIRVISQSSGKLVKTSVSDRKGHYNLALPKGSYKVITVKPNLEQTTNLTLQIKNGLIPRKDNIEMRKIKNNEEKPQ